MNAKKAIQIKFSTYTQNTTKTLPRYVNARQINQLIRNMKILHYIFTMGLLYL